MKIGYWILLVLSAVLYAVPFLYSTYMWWFIFVFPIPFLYVASQEPLSFKQGTVWAAIVFTLHLSGGISVVVCMSHGHWIVGLVLSLAVIMYLALCTGLLCVGVRRLLFIFKIQSFIGRLF